MTTSTQTRSETLFARAQELMPGGVNSPVRAFKSVGGTPLFIDRAEGAYIWDADGKRYIDYVGSWGPMILGHAHPQVIERVRELALKGTSYGAPTQLENELAEVVIDAVPSIDMLRFVNSGTEAVMSAVRLARAYTGKSIILKFEGCYHGHVDALLIKAGSGAATCGVPDSAGVPEQTTNNTVIAPFNDLESVKTLFTAFEGKIAGILVEPVAGNMGCVPPKTGFLEGLRSLCNQHNALLIFDEVMTGFRVAYGGAQSLYNVTPDITTLGKIVGGGLPVGAYGASKDIMSCVAPLGGMYQAGTLSGNPLAMGAGLETLKLLRDTPDLYPQLEAQTQKLLTGLATIASEHHIATQAYSVGSMFSMFYTDTPIENYAYVLQSDKTLFNKLFHKLLDAGVYLAPSAFEAGFVSTCHTDDVIQATLAAYQSVLSAT